MPNDILKQLGHQMREARKARGLTQEQLSAQTNVSVRHIAKIEKGTMNTSFEILHTLVTCLGTSLDVLLYPDLPMEQQEVAKLVGCYKADRTETKGSGAPRANWARSKWIKPASKIELPAGFFFSFIGQSVIFAPIYKLFFYLF